MIEGKSTNIVLIDGVASVNLIPKGNAQETWKDESI